MKAPRAKRIDAGFTLIEIMVSIAILALIALMAARIFTESSRAVAQGKDDALLDEAARLLLDTIEQDVSQALVRTNVAFRVHDVSVGKTLYFISTGNRRHNETLLRDMAPMRIRTRQKISDDDGLENDLHRTVVFEYASDSDKKDLIAISDIYHGTGQTAGDFQPLNGDEEMNINDVEYTEELSGTSTTEQQAMLTFLDFIINADASSNVSSDMPAIANNLPRFVDVTIGLVPSRELAPAMRLYTAQGPAAASRHLDQHERIYTRRIFMRNTGTAQLDL